MQWRSQLKIFWGHKSFDFKRTAVFCLRQHLSKHEIGRYARNLGDMPPFPAIRPWLRPWCEMEAGKYLFILWPKSFPQFWRANKQKI